MIVFFAGSAYDGVAGTDRHLADELSRQRPVLYVEPPCSVLTPLLRARPVAAIRASSMRSPALREERPGLWRLVPRVLPGAQRPGMHHVTTRWTRAKVRRAAARIGQPVTAAIATVSEDLLDAVAGVPTMYFVTDDGAAGAELLGLPRRRLLAAERRQAEAADVLAVVSPVLRERFAAMGLDAAVVPNGCSPDAYEGVDEAPWPDDVPRFDRPAAGFVGNLNGRLDLDLLEGVADAGHPLLLVGPRQPSCPAERFAALTARPNVVWTGMRPHTELPRYLRAITVGLTPYVLNDFNRASFPLKTLEYLAAGRAVVSTALPATDWLREDAEGAALIRVESSREAFVKAVGDELAAAAESGNTEPGKPEQNKGEHSMAGRRRAYAARHDWKHRAREIAGLLDQVGGPRDSGDQARSGR
ncbi:teichuronic acid biosynthesis glycosyltransferase TuaH [Actinopolymorpha cephalotaxi]|uniref:Teichuronic acid biosynthesis glycosyltransferase TuaH n=1 Tax=Actinopolymorpha cephalotaxi TaxID=504797 RepID=A0A1I2WML4_9ACTN|nr:teichuronic acid biosynthesis glycosyltransferase TuaH [Actinopolymorpha cephalotaxi]